MTSQTRIGIAVLILLVGCLLAIPHFRHPLPSHADEQIQRASLGEGNRLDAGAAEDDPETTLQLKAKPANSATRLALVDSTISSRGSQPYPTEPRRREPPDALIYRSPVPGRHEQWKFPPVQKPQDGERERRRNGASAADLSTTAQTTALDDLAARRPRPLRLPPEAMSSLGADQTDAGAPPVPLPSSPAAQPGPDPLRVAQNPSSNNPNANAGQSRFVERREFRTLANEPALHRIVNGDTLENLAQQYYGDRNKAMLIFETNRDSLLNPAILPLGVDLKIPDVQ